MPKHNQNNDFDGRGKKKMSLFAKIVSGVIVFLLLFGLVFAIFAFVDHSNRANERLSDQKQEEKEKRED